MSSCLPPQTVAKNSEDVMHVSQLSKRWITILLTGALLILAAGPLAVSATNYHPELSGDEATTLREDMRMLWEDHIVWTRMYIVSFVAELPDQEIAAERLLQNQTDIGNAIAMYYGEEAGAQLTALLRGHILGAVDLLEAAKSGDTVALDTASSAWYRNGDEIAAFLNAANPDNWPLADLQAEMKMHLDHTLQEATARLQGDYSADVAAYDAVHVHILGMADLLSNGIIAQFPSQFA